MTRARRRIAKATADFFRLIPAPRDQARQATITTACMAVSILTITAVAGFSLGPMAMFGSLIAFWGPGRPLRARLRTFALVGAVFPLSLGLGVLVGPVRWAAAAVVVVVVLICAALYHALAPSGPGPLNLFFACSMGTYLGATTHIGLQIMAVTAASAALTALLCLHEFIGHPHRPEQTALAAAHETVASFRTGDDTHGEHASAALHHAWAVLRSAESRRRPSATHRAMESELADLNRAFGQHLLGVHCTPATGATAATAVPMLGRPSTASLMRRLLRRHSPSRMIAMRNGLAAALAVCAAELAQLDRPYWAVLSATVVLHAGGDRASTTVRGAHRVAGSLLGVVAAAGIEATHPASAVQLLLVLAGAWGMNLLLPRNYTYAVICATVMAVAANIATAPTTSVADMLLARTQESLLGVACALLVLWVTGHRAHHMIDRQFRSTVNALARVLEHVHSGSAATTPGLAARRDLRFELNAHRAVLDRAGKDRQTLQSWNTVDQALSTLSHHAFALCWTPNPHGSACPPPQTSQSLRDLLRNLPPAAPGRVDSDHIAATLARTPAPTG